MHFSIASITFFGLAVSCAFIGWILVSREIDEVNRKLPEIEKISLGYMYPGKMQAIRAAYRRLYPDGNVERLRVIAQVAMFIFLALTALSAGFLK